MNESRGSIEANRQPLLAGRETEPDTNVGLAGAAVADRDDVLPAGHILRAGELQHEGLVERRNGGEVEAVQTLHGREPRLLDPTLDHPPFAVDQLQFGQAQQKANMIEALGGALPSELVVLSQARRQLERLQVMGKQKLGRIGHDVAPVSRPRYVLADVHGLAADTDRLSCRGTAVAVRCGTAPGASLHRIRLLHARWRRAPRQQPHRRGIPPSAAEPAQTRACPACPSGLPEDAAVWRTLPVAASRPVAQLGLAR